MDKKLRVDEFKDEDELDSDEEVEVNRIGDVPLAYYELEDHVGYDILGKRIPQLFRIRETEINRLLAEAGDNESWRKIVDLKNQKVTRLTNEDLELIRRIRENRIGLRDEDDREISVEFVHDELKTQPLKPTNVSRDQFRPNAATERVIDHLVRLLRSGKLKPRQRQPRLSLGDIWGEAILPHEAIDIGGGGAPTSLAQKPSKPSNAYSYNPPEEYLFSPEEKQKWENSHPFDRDLDFIPQSFKSLRHVPGYLNGLKERFLRQLNLHMAPRITKKVFIGTSHDLLPELPPTQSFKPYPEFKRLVFRLPGHTPISSINIKQNLIGVGTEEGSLTIFDTTRLTLPHISFLATSRTHHYALNAVKWHPTLPIITFVRNSFLFICLLKLPSLNLQMNAATIKRLWNNKASAKRHDPASRPNAAAELPEDESHDGIGQDFIDALSLMRINYESVEEIDLRFKISQVCGPKSWRSFVNKKYYFAGSIAKTNIETYPDQPATDDEIETEMSEDETTGHTLLVQKDWAETVKFVKMISENKNLVCGYIVNLPTGPVEDTDIHRKGLYIGTATPKSSKPTLQCLVHSLKKKSTIAPLKNRRVPDVITGIKFHPTLTSVCLCGHKSIRVYPLVAKKAVTEVKGDKTTTSVVDDTTDLRKFSSMFTNTSMDVHPSGQHLTAVTAEGKLTWFDFYAGAEPFQTLE